MGCIDKHGSIILGKGINHIHFAPGLPSDTDNGDDLKREGHVKYAFILMVVLALCFTRATIV